MSSISTQLVEEKVEQMLYHGRLDGKGGLSPKTVTDIITIIKSSIDYASYHGYVISCNLHRLSVKRKGKEMRVLSQQEQKRLLEVLMQDTDLYKLGVLISLYTGIRIGELCGLQWKHIHLFKGILEIRQTMQRLSNVSAQGRERTRIIITEPKSQSSCRDIPLPRFLIEILKNYQSEPQAYFLTGETFKYVEPRTMQNRFQRYVKESGISHVNFHALRHTFATRCIELGFEVKSLSEILGHANVNITLNRYVHSSFELKRANMEKLDSAIGF